MRMKKNWSPTGINVKQANVIEEVFRHGAFTMYCFSIQVNFLLSYELISIFYE